MDSDIKIAYLISGYKLPHQLVALVKSLWCSYDIFLIHIDKKSTDDINTAVIDGLSGYKNVIFLDRHSCNWGDFGHVQATLKGIKYLIENEVSFTNFVVITGQDAPINDLNETRHLIKTAKNSMEYFELPTHNWAQEGLNRIYEGHYWFRGRHYSFAHAIYKKRAERILRTAFRESPSPKFYGGSSYFQLEADLVNYIYSMIEKYPDLEKFFRRTYISDEMFFQTIILNSHYGRKIHNSSRRYIDWTDPVEIPKIFRKKDRSKIASSSQIFARKFDVTVDEEIFKSFTGQYE